MKYIFPVATLQRNVDRMRWTGEDDLSHDFELHTSVSKGPESGTSYCGDQKNATAKTPLKKEEELTARRRSAIDLSGGEWLIPLLAHLVFLASDR